MLPTTATYLLGSFLEPTKTDRGLDESTQRLRVCLTHDGRIRPVARVASSATNP